MTNYKREAIFNKDVYIYVVTYLGFYTLMTNIKTESLTLCLYKAVCLINKIWFNKSQ